MNSKTVTVLGLVALVACSRAEIPATPPDKEASAAIEKASAIEEIASNPTGALSGNMVMKKSCAGLEMHLVLDAPVQSAGADAQRITSLKLLDGTGQQVAIAKPAEMKGYTAVGLGCAVAGVDGEPYFVAQYGELPDGCSFCEWYYLYDANGNQLTHSYPPVIERKSMPEAQQQLPNNAEYEALIAKLGIRHPEVGYIK